MRRHQPQSNNDCPASNNYREYTRLRGWSYTIATVIMVPGILRCLRASERGSPPHVLNAVMADDNLLQVTQVVLFMDNTFMSDIKTRHA